MDGEPTTASTASVIDTTWLGMGNAAPLPDMQHKLDEATTTPPENMVPDYHGEPLHALQDEVGASGGEGRAPWSASPPWERETEPWLEETQPLSEPEVALELPAPCLPATGPSRAQVGKRPRGSMLKLRAVAKAKRTCSQPNYMMSSTPFQPIGLPSPGLQLQDVDAPDRWMMTQSLDVDLSWGPAVGSLVSTDMSPAPLSPNTSSGTPEFAAGDVPTLPTNLDDSSSVQLANHATSASRKRAGKKSGATTVPAPEKRIGGDTSAVLQEALKAATWRMLCASSNPSIHLPP